MGKVGRNQMVRIADYVNPPDAAEIVGCTKGRIYQMLRDGDFTDLLQISEKRFMIGRKEVEKVAKNPSSTGRPRKKMAS